MLQVLQDFQAKTLLDFQVLQVQPVEPESRDDQVNAVEPDNEVTEVLQVKWELQVIKVFQALPVEPANQDQKVHKVKSVCSGFLGNEVFQVTEANLVKQVDQVDAVFEVNVVQKVQAQPWPIFYSLFQLSCLVMQALTVKLALQVKPVQTVYQVNEVQVVQKVQPV